MTTAAVLMFGTATAVAQEDPSTPSAPTETTAPPTETTAPPTTETQTPTSTPTPTEPSTPSETTTPPSEPTNPTTPSAPTETSTPTAPAKPEEPKKDEVKLEAPEGPKADLKVALSFDKPEYERYEDLGLTLTVTNTGKAPAQGIRFETNNESVWLKSGGEQLNSRPTVGAGEQKTFKFTAVSRYDRNDYVSFFVRAYLEGIADPTPSNNEQRTQAKQIQRGGTATGVVYVDKNGNGKADAGEGLANTYVGAFDRSRNTGFGFSTDADGRYQFAEFPGRYFLSLSNYPQPDKRVIKPGAFDLEDGKTANVDLAVIDSVADRLTPKVEFDKEQYGKDDTVGVKVTLTNTGQTALNGVVANCIVSENYLSGEGPGWATLHPDGPGVTVAAGETKVVTVTDVIPEAAYLNGEVGVACNFGNNGRNITNTVGASDWSKVVGAFGDVKGKVVNQQTGQPAANVRIVALDAETRRALKPWNSDVTDENGEWRIDRVRQGKTLFQAVGSWKHADGGNGVLVDVVGGKEATADFAVVPGPNVPDPTENKPDLKFEASFDKPSYDVYDVVQIKVKITNVGTGFPYSSYVTAESVPNPVEYDYKQFNVLNSHRVGLWPGESREVTLTGTVPQYMPGDSVAFKARFNFPDTNPNNDSVSISAPVTFDTGHASVTVYGDRNDNGKLDGGEELAGRVINQHGGRPSRTNQGTTDASGKVLFRDLPAGKHSAYPLLSEDDEWVPESSEYLAFVVDKDGETNVQLRMVRPLTETVEAKMQFLRDTYKPGEQVDLSATVQNNGDKTLRIKADCNWEGPSFYVENDNAEWDDWIRGGAGYVVEPHTTINLVVRQPMPELSPDFGLVGAMCTFGTDPFSSGNPRATAFAKVPGATQATTGQLLTDTPGGSKPVSNTKIVLLDPETEKPVARSTTDADGNYSFPELSVGPYTPVVVGPWKVLYGEYWVVRGRAETNIYVEPGPDVVDPETGDVAPPPHAKTPPLNAIKGGGLATTGASVMGLTAFGLLMVMAGAALTRGRRRPATA